MNAGGDRARSQTVRHRWEQAVRADPRVKGVALAVLFVAASYGDLDGTNIRVGVDRLVSDTGTSEATVKRALELGRRLGYVQRITRGHRAGDGSSRPSEHRLMIPLLPVSTAHDGSVEQGSTDHARAEETPSTAHDGRLNSSESAS